jgi:4'-phosphopantetheinyl transferase
MSIAASATEVHVWYCLADDPPWADVQPAYLALLSADERDRYHRFMFAKDRRQFLLARALVRTVLSSYAPTAPHAWQFATAPHGKPYVAASHGAPALQFNHSHADAIVACAVTHSRRVGIDVESLDRRVNVGIARHCLAPAELLQFARLDPRDQQSFLLRAWTLKEAYAKAVGLGLALPLTAVAFEFAEQGRTTIVDGGGGTVAIDAQQWQFRQWLLDERHYLAVAVECPVDQPCQFILRHSTPLLPESTGP